MNVNHLLTKDLSQLVDLRFDTDSVDDNIGFIGQILAPLGQNVSNPFSFRFSIQGFARRLQWPALVRGFGAN